MNDFEISEARKKFNWETIAQGFWQRLSGAIPQVELNVASKPSLLWIGDAGISTGFAKCTHEILDVLRRDYDVHVLGINYFGDPHAYPYPIYPARSFYAGADMWGLSRIPELADKIRPDFAIVQNDPWNFPRYLKVLGNIPTIGIVAVDGKNCRGAMLNGLRLAIFWTKFGQDEARKGGYTGPACVIPLGVDTKMFFPMSKQAARQLLPLSQPNKERIKNAFIVGVVNRNQPRKRLDLTMKIFKEWINSRKIEDAYLMFHVAPTGDDAWDLPQLAQYYGIAKRCIFLEPELGHGVPEAELNAVYNCMDVTFSTTQGEGWWLPGIEAMAAGIPVIAPDWSALGEWARPAARLVPCTDTAATLNRINVIGGIIDSGEAMLALDDVYHKPEYREELSQKSLLLAQSPEYRWPAIGHSYLDALDQVLSIETVGV